MTNPSRSHPAAARRFQNRAGRPDRHDRFKPSRSNAIELQPNDQEVLRLADRCRFVDSRQLRLTVGRGFNERAFLRRLQQLFHAEYLDRPPYQLGRWWTNRQPNRHYVYALGINGHRLLYPHLHQKGAAGTDWRLKNQRVQPLSIDHRLLVTEAVLTFFLAGEQLGLTMATWLEGKEFHQATGLPQYVVITTPATEVDVPLNPDAYFVLAHAGGRRDHFFLEVDRGTEPVVRSQWNRTSIRRKLAAYWQLYRTRVAERAGIPSFRVLTVTTSNTRVDNMRALARAMDPKHKGSSMFLFATTGQITLDDAAPALTAPIWLPPVESSPPRPLLA